MCLDPVEFFYLSRTRLKLLHPRKKGITSWFWCFMNQKASSFCQKLHQQNWRNFYDTSMKTLWWTCHCHELWYQKASMIKKSTEFLKSYFKTCLCECLWLEVLHVQSVRRKVEGVEWRVWKKPCLILNFLIQISCLGLVSVSKNQFTEFSVSSQYRKIILQNSRSRLGLEILTNWNPFYLLVHVQMKPISRLHL